MFLVSGMGAGKLMDVAGLALGDVSVAARSVGSLFGRAAVEVESLPNFATRNLLENHFNDHGSEFKTSFSTPDEYLLGARDVMDNGIKVEYSYDGEIRVGHVRFAGTSRQKPIMFDHKKPGVAKFEFVGTNNVGNITTFHIQSGKKFWKTINGHSSNKNIDVYEHLYPEEEFNNSFTP